MTWHYYRLATDIGVLLAASAIATYCWSRPRRRSYAPGYALIAGAAAGEVIRETFWPARGTITDLSFTLIGLALLASGFISIMRQWRRERTS